MGCGMRREERCKLEKVSKPAESVDSDSVGAVVAAVDADMNGSDSCAMARPGGCRNLETVPGVGCGDGAGAMPLPPALKEEATGSPKSKLVLLLFSISFCLSTFAFSFALSSAMRSL